MRLHALMSKKNGLYFNLVEKNGTISYEANGGSMSGGKLPHFFEEWLIRPFVNGSYSYNPWHLLKDHDINDVRVVKFELSQLTDNSGA